MGEIDMRFLGRHPINKEEEGPPVHNGPRSCRARLVEAFIERNFLEMFREGKYTRKRTRVGRDGK